MSLVIKKRGQVKLSFGMIFSIILIVAFLAFTIYAITKLLEVQRNIQVGSFADSLQEDVDEKWKGGMGSEEAEYRLPKGIQAVCFTDFYSSAKGSKKEIYDELKQVFFEYENMVFYPIGSAEGLDAKEIKHINITKMTLEENPYCIENINGQIQLTVKMSPGDSLVGIIK